jgi:hypothetical protein
VVLPFAVFLVAGIVYNATVSTVGNCLVSCNSIDVGTFLNSGIPDAWSKITSGDFLGLILGSITALSWTNALSIILAVLGSILLILVGLAANIQIFATGFGVGERGAKLAQTVGLSLIIWSIANAFVGNWISTLPYGFGALIQLVLIMVQLIGTFQWSQEWQ